MPELAIMLLITGLGSAVWAGWDLNSWSQGDERRLFWAIYWFITSIACLILFAMVGLDMLYGVEQ